MAFSNTFDTTNTGSAVSNREDLLPDLTILAPEETPVLSSAKKSKANATFVEWTVDALASPVTTGIAEGSDVTTYTDKFAGRARIGNYVQKLRRDYMVSDLQGAVESVGPAKIAQAEAKAVKEIKRDIEATLLSTNDRAVENGGGTAYAMRGFGKWLTTDGPSDVPSAYRMPTGNQATNGAVTETVFNNLITSIYRVTGTTNSLTLVADTALRRVISDYARLSGSADYSVRRVDYTGGSGTIKLGVQMYESDHGMVSIVNMNPDCAPDTTNKDTGYFLNPEYYGIAELITLGSTRGVNNGGGDRGWVDWTGTLICNHPGAHGKITAIT